MKYFKSSLSVMLCACMLLSSALTTGFAEFEAIEAVEQVEYEANPESGQDTDGYILPENLTDSEGLDFESANILVTDEAANPEDLMLPAEMEPGSDVMQPQEEFQESEEVSLNAAGNSSGTEPESEDSLDAKPETMPESNLTDIPEEALNDVTSAVAMETVEEPETVLFVLPDSETVCAEQGADNEDLLNNYVEQALESAIPRLLLFSSGRGVGSRFTGAQRTIYYTLQGLIAETAAGNLSSTVYRVDLSGLNLEITAQQLGYTEINHGNYNDVYRDALAAWGIDADTLLAALLADSPYELYWFDKTKGLRFGTGDTDCEITTRRIQLNALTYSFAVASEYAAGEYAVDSSYGQTISNAISNAKNVVTNAAAFSDREKLQFYRQQICALVSYNSAASGAPYGNPWQLIWVFDGNSATNVVCEGYAKAFQYLCELSSFASGMINCYTVTGIMNGGLGAGNHMWNLVTLDDGGNYLVDVTNCDSGTAGYEDQLFLRPYDEGSISSGYRMNLRNGSIIYQYDEDTLSIFTAEELMLTGDPAGQEEPFSYTSVEISETAIGLGSIVTFKPVLQGGSGRYDLVYSVYDGSGRRLKNIQTDSSSDPYYEFTPEYAGSFYCIIQAKDAMGTDWKSIRSETVTAYDIIKSLSATIQNLAAPAAQATYVGQSLDVIPNISGTALLYCFRVYDSADTMIAESFAGSRYQYTPGAAGRYYVIVLAYDGISWTAAPRAYFEVYEKVSYSHVNLSTISAKKGDTLYMAPVFSGGIPDMQFIYCVFDQNTQLTMDVTGSTNWCYTFTHAGTYHVDIYVADATGSWQVKTSYSITVANSTPLSIQSINVSDAYLTAGTAIHYKVTYTGVPTTFIYCVFRDGQQLTMTYSSSDTFSYIPTSVGNYQITIYAYDGLVWTFQTAAVSTRVGPAGQLAIQTIIPNKSSYNAGEVMEFRPVMTGVTGSASFIYCIFRDGVQLTMDSRTDLTYSYIPTVPGQYRLDVYATDSKGSWAVSSTENISVTMQQLRIDLSLSANVLHAGESVTVFATGVGGTGIPYGYIYCLFNESIQLTMDESTAESYSYPLTAPGNYRIDVYCHDSGNNWTMVRGETITVT